MAMSGSYKVKTETLATLLRQRTAEAVGWKKIAESRLADLATLSQTIAHIEKAALSTSLFETTGMAPWSVRAEVIEEANDIREAVDGVDDVEHVLLRFLQHADAIIADSAEIMERTLALETEDLRLPDTDELTAMTNGLSLEELGRVPSPDLAVTLESELRTSTTEMPGSDTSSPEPIIPVLTRTEGHIKKKTTNAGTTRKGSKSK
jgi:hypothetical protein